MLEQWVMIRAFSFSDYLINQLKPATITSYLSILRSYYVNRRIDIAVFDSPYFLRLVQGARGLFPSKKRERLPIIRDILLKIISPFTSRNDYHINAAFKLAFVSFLRISEFIYTRIKKITLFFKVIRFIRSDFTLFTDYTIIRLKRSKTEKIYQGVNILVVNTGDSNYSV